MNEATNPFGDAEAARLAALRRYRILDTPPEALYDDITRLASQLCSVPISLVSFIDETRQWFKSRQGLDATETPREVAFCDIAIRSSALLEVPDATADPRFRDNPLVTGPPGIRFYAGHPLETFDGHRLGTVCVIDTAPRELDDDQREALGVLARQVITQLELRRALAEASASEAALRSKSERLQIANDARRAAERLTRGTLDALHDNIAILGQDGTILDVNRAWADFEAERPTDDAETGIGANYLAVCDRAADAGCHDAALIAEAIRSAFAGDPVDGFRLEYPCHAPDEQRWYGARLSGFGKDGVDFVVVVHEDITPRYEAEQNLVALNETLERRVAERTASLEAAHASLRTSEERFRSLFEDAGAGMVLADRRGRLREANRAFAAMAGRDADALRELTLQDLVDGSDAQMLGTAIERLYDGDVPSFEADVRHPVPGGGHGWAHVSMAAIADDDGRTEQVLGLIQDITDQREAERQRDRFFEFSVDMFLIADYEGRVYRANPACTRILGYPEEELVGAQMLELVHPEDRARVVGRLAALSRGEAETYLDFRLRTGDGRYRDTRWSAAPWSEDKRIVAVGRDVTRIRSAERALIERDEMLARAERMASIGSWHWSIDDDAIRCSEGLYAMAGLEPGTEMRGLDALIELARQEFRARIRQSIGHVVADGGSADVVTEIERPDGAVRIVKAFIEAKRGEHGRVVGVSGACLDVTEFERAVRGLRDSEARLRALGLRLDRIREEERTSISREIHDELGQMLTALKMDVSLLARDLDADRPVPARETLVDALVSIGELVDATLESARRVARQLRPEVLDALGLVPAIEWLAREFQTRTGIACTVAASAGRPALSAEARTAVFRIVQEALTNVARHADASRVNVVLERAGTRLVIVVRDDGRGIANDALQGTASLGLLGMRERSTAVGATFRIDGVPGEGTTVTLRVPLQAEAATVKTTDAAAEPGG